MKGFVVLILWVTTVSLTFSQTLKPILLTENGVTLFAFDSVQVKYIAKTIIKAQECEFNVMNYDNALNACDTALSSKNNQIAGLEQAARVDAAIMGNNEQEITLRKSDIESLKKEIRRHKWQKRGAIGIAILVAALALL